MAEPTGARASSAGRGAGALHAARGRAKFAGGLMGAFLAGVLIATAVAPDGRDAAPATVATGALDAPSTDGTFAPSSGDVGSTGDVTPVPSPGGVTPAAPSPSPGSGAAGTGGSATGATPTTAAPGDFRAAPAGGNGGATFRGVTAGAVRVVHLGFDSNALGAACPRCGDKRAPELAGRALVEAWRRDGKLPIYGRDLEISNRKFGLSPEESRNACVSIANQDKPFVVIGQGFDSQCIGREFHIFALSGSTIGTNDLMAQSAPYAYSVQATFDRTLRNFAHFAEKYGYLKGQTLGIYEPSANRDMIGKSFVAELTKMGYKVAVTVDYDATNTASSDAVAVQRMRTGAVTSVFVLTGAGTAGLTEPSGFQRAAEAQGYRPKYAIPEMSVETVDAVGDVAYVAAAQEGNYAMRSQAWEWKTRKPATFLDNPTAQYCLEAYSKVAGKVLDAYDDDAEIRQALSTCAPLEVARQAMINAGPKLDQSTFLGGLFAIRGMETSQTARSSFRPGVYGGGDTWIPVQFKSARWQPENNLWHQVGPWQPWFVQ